jgi:phosphate transport system substrate-binding protein
VGERYPDIADASRPIKPSEIENCAKHGIRDVAEITIGFDGIVIANAQDSAEYHLTRKQLFLGLAREVPKDGKLVPNPYTRWQEIDSHLPDLPIEVYGPPPAEGTRDAFVELVMDAACAQFPEYAARYPNEAERKQHCDAMREDGRFIELLGGNLMVQKLMNDENALSIFSYSFLDQNRATVKAISIDGVLPSFESISKHRYSVARSLYIYVKREHLGQIAGLDEFVRFMTSDAATGEDGFLVVKGLIPLPSAEHKAMEQKAAGLH